MKKYGTKRVLTLYQKIFFTFLILVGYRLLSHIPLPFVNRDYIQNLVDTNGALNLLNTLTGGNLENMSVVAMGITPYITASIVLQLLGVVFPRLAELQKEGSVGQKRMKQITIATGVALGAFQAVCMLIGYGRQGFLSSFTWYTVLIPSVIMVAGVFVLSYAGQFISDHLFGNGISLILVTGILCSYLSDGNSLFLTLTTGWELPLQIVFCVLAVLVVVLLFAFTVWLLYCEKQIHVTYSGKMSMYGQTGADTVIPLKLVGGSVVPIIFASSILTIPSLIQSFFGKDFTILHIFNTHYWLNPDEPWASVGLLLYFVMILGFSYYYQSLNLNERELSLNLKKHGGVIDGIRPGKPTEEYLRRQMKYLTMLGGFGLCIIAFVPICVNAFLHVQNLSFLGTSIIIVVSVLIETGKKYKADKQGQAYDVSDTFLGMKKGGKTA